MGNLPIPHLTLLQKKGPQQHIPKGHLAVKVGQEGEEQQRFWIPVVYVNHPLFLQLLRVAEDEYGFDQKGTITLPCCVTEFRKVQGLIDPESSFAKVGHGHGTTHHGHLVGCFKA